jgi:ABC-type glycerol-3-phosphate transport system permease component
MTVCIFSFVGIWNELLVALVFIFNKRIMAGMTAGAIKG